MMSLFFVTKFDLVACPTPCKKQNNTTKARGSNTNLTFGLAVLFAIPSLSLVAVAIKLHMKRPDLPPGEVHLGRSQDTISVMSMSAATTTQGNHYLDNVVFLDEGIIVPEKLDTIYESPEIL